MGRGRATVVGLVGLILLLTAVTPVAAAPPGPGAARPGGAWASFAQDGRRGIVLLRWTDGDSPAAEVSVHLAGLTPGDRVRVILGSADCDTRPDATNRLLAAWLGVGTRGPARGVVWRARKAIGLTGGVASRLRSVWLVEDKGDLAACGHASVWDDTDIVHVINGAWSVIDRPGYRGIIVLGPADTAGTDLAYSLTVGPAVTGLRLVGTSTPCTSAMAPADRLFSLRLRGPRPGQYFARRRTETVDKDETISVHGFRLRPTSGPSACGVPSSIAVLIGR